MRIRKNARLVLGGGSSASSSSSSSSFLVCQLNRSPWDAIDAFSLLQVDGDDGFGLNANTTTYFVNSIPPSDSTYSLPSGESMELSFEYVEKPPAVPQPPKREREEDEIAGLEQDMNGCRFELNESYPTPLPPPPLPQKVEPPPPPSGPKRRGRPRKPTSASAAAAATAPNPYEFYYYSGFGPQWGKRRGGHRSSSSATAAAGAKISHESEDTTTTATAFETPGSSSTTHMYMMSEDEEDFHHSSNNNSNGKMKMKCANTKDNGVDLLDSVADGEIDYIEDDDDDDDEDERGLYGSGRRARKPIKARSLKSLM